MHVVPQNAVEVSWWRTSGEEQCPHCFMFYHYEREYRCDGCDCPLCPDCEEGGRDAVLCPECAEESR